MNKAAAESTLAHPSTHGGQAETQTDSEGSEATKPEAPPSPVCGKGADKCATTQWGITQSQTSQCTSSFPQSRQSPSQPGDEGKAPGHTHECVTHRAAAMCVSACTLSYSMLIKCS